MSISAASSDEVKDSKPAWKGSHLSATDHYFHIAEHDSTTVTEIRDGVATFFAMAYIILLNLLILGNVENVNGSSLGTPQVVTVTAPTTGVMTIALGLSTKYPFDIATGLGINTLVTTTFVTNEGLAWKEAMGLIMLDDVIIVLLALIGFRTAVFHAIPSDMKTVMSVDIGLFIVTIGLVDGGLVRYIPGAADTTVPIQLSINGQVASWPTAVFVLGPITCGIMVVRNISGGLLTGIVLNTIIALAVEALTDTGPSFVDGKPVPTDRNLMVPTLPDRMGGMSDLFLVGTVDLFGSFARAGALSVVMLLSTLVLANSFSAMGTMTGLGKQAALIGRDGVLPDMKRTLVVEGTGAIVGGAVSSSSNAVFIDSAVGIVDGVRAGLVNTVTDTLFLVAMFFTPLYGIILIEAAVPVLVIIDAMMTGQIIEIDSTYFDIVLPTFLTMVTIPFTYSIANGIGIGPITFAAMAIFSGRAKSVHPLMRIVSDLFIIYFATDPLTALPGG